MEMGYYVHDTNIVAFRCFRATYGSDTCADVWLINATGKRKFHSIEDQWFLSIWGFTYSSLFFQPHSSSKKFLNAHWIYATETGKFNFSCTRRHTWSRTPALSMDVDLHAPGCSRFTNEPTRGRSHSPVPSVTVVLPIDQTCVFTRRHTCEDPVDPSSSLPSGIGFSNQGSYPVIKIGWGYQVKGNDAFFVVLGLLKGQAHLQMAE